MTMKKGKVDAKLKKSEDEVRKLAMAFPETHEDHPWEHSAFKVKKKTFLFMALDAAGLRLSFKLDQSLFNTLALPMCEPTDYGLGKSGWVTASFEAGDTLPMSHVEKWMNESYRLIAPKTIVKQLDAGGGAKGKVEKSSPALTKSDKESAKSASPGRGRAGATEIAASPSKPKTGTKPSVKTAAKIESTKKTLSKQVTAKKPSGGKPTRTQARQKPSAKKMASKTQSARKRGARLK